MSLTFGVTLENLMKQRPISARALSKKINISYKTIQEWLGRDARMPRDPNVLKKLAEFFDCSVHFLLFGTEDSKSLMGEILDKTEIHTGMYEITVKRVKTKKNL